MQAQSRQRHCHWRALGWATRPLRGVLVAAEHALGPAAEGGLGGCAFSARHALASDGIGNRSTSSSWIFH